MSEILDRFRQQNPQYQNVDDATLADGIYRKFYADKMDRAAFDAKVGLAPAVKQDPTPGNAAEAPAAFIDQINDPESAATAVLKSLGGYRNLYADRADSPPAQPQQALADPGAAVAAAVRGVNQTADLPEVRNVFVDQANDPQSAAKAVLKNLGGSFAAGTSDAQIADMVKAQFPDAQINGNVATIGGKQYQLNAPGISGQDLDNLKLNTAIGGILAPLGMGGGGMLARGLTGGAIAGGSEVGMDVAAMTEGSKQGVDWGRAGLAGAVGGALDAFLPKIVKAVGRWVKGGRQVMQNGAPTPEIQKLLEVNGIDPASIRPETWAKFEQIVKQANPDDMMAAFRMADAQSLPAPATLTTAQATQSPEAMGLMNQAENQLLGNGAYASATGGRALQGQNLAANVQGIQEKLGGGIVGNPGQGAAMAQQALADQAGTLKSQADNAYKIARELTANGPAMVPSGAAKTWGQAVNQALTERGFDLEVMPLANRYLGQLDDIGDDLGKLQIWRSRVTTAIADTTVPSERAALSIMKDGFDDWLDDVATKGLLSGDPGVLQAWKDAIGKRSELGKIFQRKDMVGALVETAKGGPDLKVSPDEAINYIFGRGELGSRANLAPDLVKLRNTLGADSEAWKALKEEAFLRLFKGQAQGVSGETAMIKGSFKPSSYNSALNKFLRDQPTAAAILFTQEDRQLLQQFGRVLEYAYGVKPLPQNVNPSGTASLAARIAKRTLGSMGFLGQASMGLLGKILGPIGDAAAAAQVGKMVQGVLPSTMPKVVTSPLAGGVVQ